MAERRPAELPTPAAGPDAAEAERLEAEAEVHVAAGRTDVAADLFDQALCLRIRAFGLCHPSLPAAAEVLTRTANHAASLELRAGGDLARAERRLQRTLALLAEVTSPMRQAVLAPCFNLTLGNLAALHQRLGRREVALLCLREAEALGPWLASSDAAATHLSLCALLSQLGQHPEAEKHALEAVRLGEADILELVSLQQSGGFATGTAVLREKVAALAVAYNNLAVQREFLGQADDCLALYEKAVVLAEGHMDPSNPLLARLRESHRNALQTVSERRRPQPAGQAPFARRPTPLLPQGSRPLSALEPRQPQHGSWRERSADGRDERALLTARSLSKELADLLRPDQKTPPPRPPATEPDALSDSSQRGDTARDAGGCAAGASSRGQRGGGRSSSTSRERHRAVSCEPLPHHMRAALRQMESAKKEVQAPRRMTSSASAGANDMGTARRGGAPEPTSSASTAGARRRQRPLALEAFPAGERAGSRTIASPSHARAGRSERCAGNSGPQRTLQQARRNAAAVRIQRAYRAHLVARATRTLKLGEPPARAGRPLRCVRSEPELSAPRRPSLGQPPPQPQEREGRRSLPQTPPWQCALPTQVAVPSAAAAAHRPPRPGSVGSAPSLSLPTLGAGADAWAAVGDSAREVHTGPIMAAAAKRTDSHRSPLRSRESEAFRALPKSAPSLHCDASSIVCSLSTSASSSTLPAPGALKVHSRAPPASPPACRGHAHVSPAARNDAALVIQCVWRRWRSQRRRQRAELLQAMLRAASERRRLAAELAAAGVLRRWFLRSAGRRLRLRARMALRIQRSWRRWRERCRWRRWREKQRRKQICNAAASCIQRAFRSFASRLACRRAAAARLLLAWRRSRRRRRGVAARAIQSAHRGSLARAGLETEGLLLAKEERSGGRWGPVCCSARRRLERRAGERGLRPAGWALLAEAGRPGLGAAPRAALEVSEAEAWGRCRRAGRHSPAPGSPWMHPAEFALRPREVAQELLKDLVVNLSNGQVLLQLRPLGAPQAEARADDMKKNVVTCSTLAGTQTQELVGMEPLEDPRPSAAARGAPEPAGAGAGAGPREAGAAAEAAPGTARLSASALAGAEELAEAEGAGEASADDSSSTADVPPAPPLEADGETASTADELVAGDAEDAEDEAAAEATLRAPGLGDESPRAECPLWRCGHCGFDNEISPDMCVLCDARRDVGPARSEQTAGPTQTSQTRLNVGRCASEHLRRLAQTGRHGVIRPSGDLCSAAARPPSARPGGRRRGRYD